MAVCNAIDVIQEMQGINFIEPEGQRFELFKINDEKKWDAGPGPIIHLLFNCTFT